MSFVFQRSFSVILVFAGLVLGCPSNLLGQSFTFNVTQPTTNALVGTNLPVQVSVISAYELQSVTASVDGNLTNLTFSASSSNWSGVLSLAGSASGPKTLTISAKDVFNNVGQVQVPFFRDLPPALTVTEPRPGTVARPAFALDIAALDDNPDAIIRVYYGATLLAIGTNTLIGEVSVPGIDGRFVTINIIATDSAGQSNQITQNLCVFSATNWVENVHADGPILDARKDSVLFADGSALKSKSLISGNETLMLDQPGIEPIAGGFTSSGAFFQTATETYDLRNGVLLDLGPCDFGASNVRDDWSTWAHFSVLNLRDELAGTNVQITASLVSSSLGPNGELVYINMPQNLTTWQVHKLKNGIDAVVVSSTPLSYSYDNVHSDGTQIIYEKNHYPMTSESYIALNDGTNETLLSTNTDWAAARSSAINSGWVAFSATSSAGVDQIWTLSPQGVREQRTFFGTSSIVRALAPNGELVFSSGGKLYLACEGVPPQELGAWNFVYTDNTGKIFWQDGKWWWQLGRSLFQLSRRPIVMQFGMSTEGMKLHVDADPGAQLILQGSDNLVDWFNLSTNTINGTGCVEWTNSSPNQPAKFYRAVIPGH